MGDMLVQPEQTIEGARPEVPWRLRDLGLSVAWVIAATIFAAMVLGIVFALVEDPSDDVENAGVLGVGLALYATVVVAVAWFSVRRYSCGWQALGFRAADRGGWWVPVAVAVAFLVAAHIVLGLYLIIVDLLGIGGLVPEGNLPEGMFESPVILPLVALMVLVAAPIAEEIFFRGFLFSTLRVRWGVFWAALASGLLFGAIHGSLGLLVPFSIIGMLLAYVYVLSGSLWTSILGHFAFNAIGFVTGVASGGGL
jgi:membrane protease YdiL (CAAX protease family)